MNNYCSNCLKEDKECKCTIDKIVGNSGFCSPVKFGSDRLSYDYVKMDGIVVLKIKLWNDIIYLGHDGIEFLNSITKGYLDVKRNEYQRRLENWECDDCGKKTNNMQEKCDECIESECECF